MPPLKLTLACWDYDRAKALQDGRVQIEGVDLNFVNLRVEETFFRQLRYQEFDIAELSLSSYTLTLNQENPPFIALPIFPSRFFRHQSIYVSKRANIKKPSDLRGKRAGCPEWQMTAPVWQRGIMEEHYDLPQSSMQWFTGAVEPSATERKEKIKLDLPSNLNVTPIGPGKCLSQMLADGDIDVLFSATQPSSFNTSDNVGHLFEDFKEVEKEYLKKTGIFPIMHVIVIKRSIHEQHPWLARSVTKAFASSLEYAYDAISERAALRYMLPWLQDHVEETRKAFGTDRYWEDGLEKNRHVIQKFLEYSYGQGLAKKLWKPEEIFAASATESYVI
ncbi:hypothetical protein PILCRDRAFT_816817 [Piloderma croceum F 1598]|uniref:SsuA/THI5-like domain-containing protein n=1 Tax=Piloderma croceum (strain F 1598) TaxID=765440 RepID=A0A0C3FP38_PILCF|nr:hypothetical protein PILCRDRAFT_816817 [Piloderma croceum F 1598]